MHPSHGIRRPTMVRSTFFLWQKEKLQQQQEHFTSLSSQEVDNTLDTEVQCPQCQILVSNLSALKTHFAVKHGVSLIAAESLTLQAQQSVDIAEHSVDGAPVCRHCRHSFRKWQSFRKHIAKHCPVLHNYQELVKTAQGMHTHPHDFDAAPLGSSALQSVAGLTPPTDVVGSGIHTTQQSVPIIKDPNVNPASLKDWIKFAEEHGGQLAHHCALCHQWCSAKTGGIKAHLRSCLSQHAQAITDAEIRLKHHYRLRYKGRCRACSFNPTRPRAKRSRLSALHISRHACCTTFSILRSNLMSSGDQAINEVSEFFRAYLPALDSTLPTEGSQTFTATAPDHKTTKEYKPKRPRTQQEEGGGSWGSWGYPKQGWKENSLSQQVSGDELRSIVAQLTRLALRHEDMEAANRVDSGFQLHMDTAGDLAMLPRLCA